MFLPAIQIALTSLLDITYRPELTFGEVISLVLVLLGFVGIIWRWYFSTHPFTMTLSVKKYDYKGNENFSESNLIQGINELYPRRLTLRLKLRRERNFEQINVTFIERRLFRWVDAQQNLVSISALYDSQIEDRSK
jgi:hypothetical protein